MSSIFLEFNLPNSTTWFYFSLFLTVALFFHFTRIFSIRNFDLLGLFLFAPGFLLILEEIPQSHPLGSDSRSSAPLLGYAWLLVVSLLWFARCFVDLGLARRPLHTPNLNMAGLIWFGSSLFLCFIAVAFTRLDDPWGRVGKQPTTLTKMQEQATEIVATVQHHRAPHSARFWGERSVAVLCHLAVVAGLISIGTWQFQDVTTGVMAGTLYLLLPYTAFHTAQVHHVWPTALIVWAVYFFRRPFTSGTLLGLAAGTLFFPALLLPAWLHFYWKRGLSRFFCGFMLSSTCGLLFTLALMYSTGDSTRAILKELKLNDLLPWYPTESVGIWQDIHWAYRLPVFILYFGMLVMIFFWPAIRNLGHLIAVTAAILIGIQFWYADGGGLYVLWYSPFLVLMVLRPNLSEMTPIAARPLPRFMFAPTRWVRQWVWPKSNDLSPTIAA